jgi:hypothetical integral membrane protein (TIGR02206 family)
MTPPAAPFRAFGPSHLAVLGITLAAGTLLSLLARRPGHPRLARLLAWGLAALLIADEVAVVALAAHDDPATLTRHLPFQLCDWVVAAAAVALVARRQTAYELAYFWGLAGTLQALVTPDLREDFPGIHFLTFQILHAGAVVAVIFLTGGLRRRPRWRSVGHAWLWLQLYLAVTAGIDLLIDANYGYLRAKPAQASLIDRLGPWPWYLVSLELLAAVLFVACYTPFAVLDAARRRRAAG